MNYSSDGLYMRRIAAFKCSYVQQQLMGLYTPQLELDLSCLCAGWHCGSAARLPAVLQHTSYEDVQQQQQPGPASALGYELHCPRYCLLLFLELVCVVAMTETLFCWAVVGVVHCMSFSLRAHESDSEARVWLWSGSTSA